MNEGGGKGEGLSQEPDHPKPTRGKSEAEKWEELDGGSKTREKGKADALKLESSLKQQRPTNSTMSVKGLSQSSTVDSFSSSKIDFGEDGDDLLSGMGLDDGTLQLLQSTLERDEGPRLTNSLALQLGKLLEDH